jgi:uncharacterized membrane protein
VEHGNSLTQSPIVAAIQQVETESTGEIRVHLSKKWIEKDPFQYANQLFQFYKMNKTTHRNTVLIYVNLRQKKFAIIGDQGIHQALGQKYWNKMANELQHNLRSTQSEKAIAQTILFLGQTLKTFFPSGHLFLVK